MTTGSTAASIELKKVVSTRVLNSFSTAPICQGLRKTDFLFYFLGIRKCVFGTSFLLTLDIYKAYFRGRHTREYKENICKRWLMPYSLWKNQLHLYTLEFCNQVLLDIYCWWSEEFCSQQSSSSGCVSHVLRAVHHWLLISHILGSVHILKSSVGGVHILKSSVVLKQ